MAYENPGFLVDPEDLDLSDPNLRLFDVSVLITLLEQGYRTESAIEKYFERHIPGANYLNLAEDLSDTTTGLLWSLPSVEALEAAFRKAGVNDDSNVVFYSGGHIMLATRAFWLANYLGQRNVAVLNGGLKRWRSEGRQLVTESPAYPPGNFSADPVYPRFVTAEDVKAAIDSEVICTVNALSPELFAGTGKRHYGRRGHIPGSKNLYFEELLEAGSFKSVEELRASLSARGVLDTERAFIYCGGGVSATVDALACLLVGYTNVSVYDGSMTEWARDGRQLKTGS